MFSNSRTALGHKRLAIIDLSNNGLQPMTVNPDIGGAFQTGITITFNGEIYNYRELRCSLIKDGHQFKSETDTEVLLHLYEREGLKMLNSLNGMFAFAIHDNRKSNRPENMPRGGLFLARDQMGVKPLYYSQTQCGFVFGSELKCLLPVPDLSRQLSYQALQQTLGFLWTPAPNTMLTDVYKLQPAHALIVSQGRVLKNWRYFQVDFDGSRSRGNFEQLSEEVEDLLYTAVKRQTQADVPIGAFLSGGLDSSAIVSQMCRAKPNQKVECFTVRLNKVGGSDDQVDDLPFARNVAQHLGVELHEVDISPDHIKMLPQLIALLDEPQADPAPLNAWMISKLAKEMGFSVLLSGVGGDDLYSGYRRHKALYFERFWGWLPQNVRAVLQHVSATQSERFGQGALRRINKIFAHAGETNSRRLSSYFLWSSDRMRHNLYSKNTHSELQNNDVLSPLLESLQDIPNEPNMLNKMLYLEQRHFLADHNLNYTDRAGMAEGVEIRVPFLDMDLVEHAAKIPPEFKQRRASSKAVLKKAMEPYLPSRIIHRPKTGFGVPLRSWLKNELLKVVEETLSEQNLKRRDVFLHPRLET